MFSKSLWHFTSAPFTFDGNKKYEDDKRQLKPSGLWLSNEDTSSISWSDFCQSQGNMDALSHITEFSVKEWNNVLIVETIKDIKTLTEKYGFTKNGDFFPHMRWDKIKRKYDGIYTPNYVKDTGIAWYDYLDCSSGVFWNLEIISSE